MVPPGHQDREVVASDGLRHTRFLTRPGGHRLPCCPGLWAILPATPGPGIRATDRGPGLGAEAGGENGGPWGSGAPGASLGPHPERIPKPAGNLHNILCKLISDSDNDLGIEELRRCYNTK